MQIRRCLRSIRKEEKYFDKHTKIKILKSLLCEAIITTLINNVYCSITCVINEEL